MTHVLDYINFGVAVAALVISLIGLVLSLTIPYSDKRYKRYFQLIFSFLMAYASSNLLMWSVSGKTGQVFVIASVVSLFCESLFSSILMPVLTMFLLFSAGKNWRGNPYFSTVVGLWALYFILLVMTQFTDWIYYFTPDNVYHRGPYYAVLLVPPALLMAVNLIALFRFRDSLTPRRRKAFFIYIIVPLACMLIQMFFYGLLMTVLGSTVSAMIMLIMILYEQIDRFVCQTRENARQKASIAILQMRPHFIYNTMMSIYYLCDKDTDEAKQVILDFSNYLRKNFTAVVREDMIPFIEESEHTRAYLAVEKARFRNRLYVEFNTPFVNFRMPPLTLQPIVENAVKHGLDPELDPLHISVTTEEVDGGVNIYVTDNGPGFGEIDNDEPHIAIKNIRQRLELMCGGSLTISQRESGGTTVTVFIPMKQK